MSEDKRKNARTQGRFSGGDKEYSSRRPDKQSTKMPSTDKHKGEKRKAPIGGSRAENEIDVQYEEDSKYTFKDVEPVKKPQEIRFSDPVMVISETDNGISRLIYDPDFMKIAEADKYFDILEGTTQWHDKNIVIRGQEYPQPRLVAWYGPHSYTYAGATLEAREMSPAVREIKEMVEATLRKYEIKVELNSVLLNLYRNEKDSVAWHSDDELSLGVCPTIASVSLGTTRRFEMRPKEHVKDFDTKDIIYVNLTHGSLIVMDGVMQRDWQHRVPKEYHDKGPRINLTFRTIYPLDQLPPEMPHMLYIKSVKSTSEKVIHQQDPKFDTENFPPLGMEANDKKTKLFPKENGGKDNQQPSIQRKSPKECRVASDKKTKSVSKSYQKSVNQRKSQKQENWDEEMLQGVEDASIQNKPNKSHDTIISSPEFHSSQIDFNSNVKAPTDLHHKQFSSNDFGKSEHYSDSSEAYQPHNYKPIDSHFKSEDPSPSESKPVEIDAKTVDFNSNVEESAKIFDKQFFPSSSINGKSGISARNKYDYEPTDNHLLEFRDPNLYESKTSEINRKPFEIEAEVSATGKKYELNADAPDFVPQNKFQNYSLSELLELSKQLRNEELFSFIDTFLNCAYAENSLLSFRDHLELDVYYNLIEAGPLSNEQLKIIVERICSMVKYAFQRQNEPRYSNKYSNRSVGENRNSRSRRFFGRPTHRY